MKQVIVGTYEIGYEQCQLVLREGSGGEFYWIPEKGSLPRIKVGADYDTWHQVVSVLVHECFEFCADRAGGRFNPTNTIQPREHGSYLFSMGHADFQDCCAKVAEFITPALPALAKAWAKWKADEKKKKAKPYVKFKVVCPKCQLPDKKILIKKLGSKNHYRCDHCGHDFTSWRGIESN